MQNRNPEQDKWIIQTELPYHRLTLVDSHAASQIAALLTAMIEWKDAKLANPKHKSVKLSVGYAYTETLVK